MQGALSFILSLAICSLLASCTSIPPRPELATAFPRQDATTPYQVLHLFHADPAAVRAQMELQDDHGVSFRRMRRMGDGSLSVGLRHETGDWFRAHECGGMLFLEGSAGQKYYLEVKNETNAPLEIAVGGSGRDWLSDAPFSVGNTGFVLRPLETYRIAAPTPLAALPEAHTPLTPFRLDESPGVITLALHHLKGQLPWEAKTPPAQHTIGKFPERKQPQQPLPHDY